MKFLLSILCTFILTGCAHNLYEWGNYEGQLNSIYSNPAEKVAFANGLKAVIDNADSLKAKMPPGIYAEYGYALIEVGKPLEAITFFNKESDLWPESRLFMKKMVNIAEKQTVISK